MIFGTAARILLLSLLPAALISLFLLRRHKHKGTEGSFYFRLALGGAATVAPASVLVYLSAVLIRGILPGDTIVTPVAAVPLIEESSKLVLLYLTLYRSPRIRSPYNAIAYSTGAAAGFSAAENILYLTGSADPLALVVARGLTAMPLHCLCGAIMGCFLWESRENGKGLSARSLIVPVMFHGLYNGIIRAQGNFIFLVFPLLSGGLIYLGYLVRKQIL